MSGATRHFGEAAPEAAGLAGDRLSVIRDALRREVDAGRLPGAVLAVARRGRLGLIETVGARDPASGAPLATNSIFSIASMTKPMTSVAILQLFERGEILLGDPVSAYIPAFEELRLGTTDADGRLRKVAAGRIPTIQDLLRHTSGLTYHNRGDTAIHAAYPGSSTSAAMSLTKEQAINTLASVPLLFEPGTAWEYGFSTDVLGFVVEAVSGQTLGDYMAANIWQPLGMTETAFDLTDQTAGRHALPFASDPLTGGEQAVYHQLDGTKHWHSGGGGAVSTALDYLAFCEALRRGGSLGGAQLLGPRTVHLMTCDHLTAGTVNRIADTMDPAAEGYGFGLGVAVRRADGVSAMAGSAGDYYWSGVFGTYFWIDPAQEMSCVFMAAAPGQIRLRFRQLARALVYQAIGG